MKCLPGHIAKGSIVLLLKEQRKNHGEIPGFLLRPRIPAICLPNLNLSQQSWRSTATIIHAWAAVTQGRIFFCLAKKCSQGVWQQLAPLVVEFPTVKLQSCTGGVSQLLLIWCSGWEKGGKGGPRSSQEGSSFWCRAACFTSLRWGKSSSLIFLPTVPSVMPMWLAGINPPPRENKRLKWLFC